MTKRPSWKKYFKKIVKNTSKRSVCPRLQVGCLLVKKNRIISYIDDYNNNPNVETLSNLTDVKISQI
jgi:deoxycytidylate deaminase